MRFLTQPPAYPRGLSPLSLLSRNLGPLDKTQEGLSEDPLTNPEEIWYTDGSSFVLDGKRRAEYTVVSNFETIEVKPLPPSTSAQLAELIALTRAPSMPFWCYMDMELFGKKGAT